MNHTTPAIVAQASARALPRVVMLLLALAYVLPGFLGRAPWRNADLAAFGVVWDMVHVSGDWWRPQVLGQAAEVQAWLPYWLGAWAVQALPVLPPDLASRLPAGLMLLGTLLCTWYATYHLARSPQAQPVSFAFGGEAQPTDYARAMADAAVLALMACLGLALLSHQATPAVAQLFGAALLWQGAARLGSPPPRAAWRTVAAWWLGSACLATSGAPWLALVLGGGWLLGLAIQRGKGIAGATAGLWWLCAAGTLGAWAVSLWGLGHQTDWSPWGNAWTLDTGRWSRYTQLLLWFNWPAWPLALWTLWRWRRRWWNLHVALPLWLVGVGLVSAWVTPGSDRALLLVLPALAGLAAFALPTMRRSVTAFIDWFALLFFSACVVVIWVYGAAMHTGAPAKAAATVARLAPGLEIIPWQSGLVLPAALATAAWLGVLVWRVGRHRPALWKSLVLSATGSTVCWLLLMTLWLPLLDLGLSDARLARRIADQAPPGACALVHGLTQGQIAALQLHGRLALARATGPGAPGTDGCKLLVVEPSAYTSLGSVVNMADWRLLASVPRLRENRDSLLVFGR